MDCLSKYLGVSQVSMVEVQSRLNPCFVQQSCIGGLGTAPLLELVAMSTRMWVEQQPLEMGIS